MQDTSSNVLSLLPCAAADCFELDRSAPRAGGGWRVDDVTVQYMPNCGCITARQWRLRGQPCGCHGTTGGANQQPRPGMVDENAAKQQIEQLLADDDNAWWLFSQIRMRVPNIPTATRSPCKKKRKATHRKPPTTVTLRTDCVVMLHESASSFGECAFAVEIDGDSHARGSVDRLGDIDHNRQRKQDALATKGVDLIVWRVGDGFLDENRAAVLSAMQTVCRHVNV